MSRLGLAAYALAAVVIALDQLSKWWILNVLRLPERLSVEVLPFFSLSMVWNTGFSFGLGGGGGELGRWLLSGFSLVVALALAVWARQATRPLTATALGLVIGGAVGNLIDRIQHGAVADFLDFSELLKIGSVKLFPWVFNVADAAISVGIVLLLLDSLLTPDPVKAKPSVS